MGGGRLTTGALPVCMSVSVSDRHRTPSPTGKVVQELL